MRRFRIPTLSLLLTPGFSIAGVINLGSILPNNIAVLGYDSGFPTSSNVNVVNASSTINITGNVVSPIVNNAAGLTFSPGSGTSAITMTEENDLANVVSQLAAVSYQTLSLTSGAVNIIIRPRTTSFPALSALIRLSN